MQAPQPLIWTSGIDRDFIVAATLMLLLSAATGWLCWQTARVRAEAMVLSRAIHR